MGRRKIEIKAIKDDRNRSVTFLKRKGGLFKKAHELSVLCSVDVAVIIFGHNKKLYEFSSGDIQETLGRYSYYGGPHEHKGPEDFMGKKDVDEDDDEEGGDEERPDSRSPPTHAMMPHHLQNQPAFQHMGTPSASPPMPNGAFHHRGPSPQPPHPMSRPGSRAHIRHPSSNLVPPPHPHLQVTQPPQPQQPSYAYMPNPPIYNPQAATSMQMRPQPGQPQPPPQFQYTQPPPQHPPQHPQQPMPHAQMQQVYQQGQQRRQSGPPNIPPQEQHPPQPGPQPSPQPPQQQFQQSPPLPQPKPLPASAKNNSIFTPIDDSRSLLAQHWGSSSQAEPQRSEPAVKMEGGPRSQSIDVAAMNRTHINGINGHPPPQVHITTNAPPQPQRTASTPVISNIPPQPPSRTNSLQAGRPRLKVQIPSEQEDDEKQTGGSSPYAPANNAVTPIRAGAVLPPPSPSAASALLSAGATGPPNPFARPAPPATNGTFGGSRSDLETPISALPSRFMSEQLLGSPSSFDLYSFGKDNTLPSPLASLNFGQTPLGPNGSSFRDDDADRKRKVSDPVDENQAKRIKA